MGYIGWTTKLEHSTVPATTYTQISDTVTIQIPGAEVSEVEDTHLGVANGIRSYTMGLKDVGRVKAECNWSKATLVAIDGLVGVNRTWRVTAPDEDGAGAGTAQTATFTGFIAKREPTEFQPNEIAKTSFEIRLTGAVTFA